MKLKLSLVLFVLIAIVFSTLHGTPAGQEQHAPERIRRVENGLIPLDQNKQPGQPAKLADRMQFYKVPGVSIAVVNRGKLEWTSCPVRSGVTPAMKDFPIATVSRRYGRQITNQGIGFRLEGDGSSARFSHHGGNVGYRCFIVAYVSSGEGAIVMTNSDNGFELVQE